MRPCGLEIELLYNVVFVFCYRCQQGDAEDGSSSSGSSSGSGSDSDSSSDGEEEAPTPAPPPPPSSTKKNARTPRGKKVNPVKKKEKPVDIFRWNYR